MSRGKSRKTKQLTNDEQFEIDFGSDRRPVTEKTILQTLKVEIKCKTENQKALINSVKENIFTIVNGLAGTGKAQPLDSLVLTPNGYIKMGDINVNDYVISADGTPTKVTGVFPQGEKEIYKIYFSDGTSTECCGEHLWLTQTYSDRNYIKLIRNGSEPRIKVGEKGREGTVKNTIEIMNSLLVGNKSKKTNHSIPIVKPIQFDKKNIKIDSYLLGCLLGDGGFTSTTLSFTTNDEEILNEVSNRLPENHVISERYHQNFTIKSIGVKENKITEYLKSSNLFGLKSDDKFIPNEYLFNDIETRLEILQGLMDTDGTVDKRTGVPIFYSTSVKLIEDVTFIVQSLGGIVRKSEKIGKYKKLNGEIRKCKKSYVLHINLPSEFTPFKLQRKIKLLKTRVKYFPIRYIKNIELIGNKEAQCIMVDNDKHLYLTNDCIVTHNTYLACAEALRLMIHDEKIKKIVLVKSITPLKGEDIGSLPGEIKDKMGPIMESFMDNIKKIVGQPMAEKLLEYGFIEVLPIAFARGRSIDNAVIIIDEAQNISLDNIRTLMTRIGTDSKVVILGDVKQKDIKNKKESSLGIVLERFRDVNGFGCIELRAKEDVVRHPLIQTIDEIFDDILGE